MLKNRVLIKLFFTTVFLINLLSSSCYAQKQINIFNDNETFKVFCVERVVMKGYEHVIKYDLLDSLLGDGSFKIIVTDNDFKKIVFIEKNDTSNVYAYYKNNELVYINSMISKKNATIIPFKKDSINQKQIIAQKVIKTSIYPATILIYDEKEKPVLKIYYDYEIANTVEVKYSLKEYNKEYKSRFDLLESLPYFNNRKISLEQLKKIKDACL